MRLIIILLVILAHVSHAQNLASILIVSDKNARVLFDGAEIGQLLKNKPGKFEVTSGEHYLQVICQCPEMLEKNEILNLEDNVQKVLKFEFGETQPDSHINEKLISEIAFSIPGVLSGSTEAPVENPVFYYAFETGDKVILDMKMTNAKGTNNLQVISYPDGQTVFSKSNFQHLNKLNIPIHKRGIYDFSFSTNHAFGRNAKLNVYRSAASKETENFNSLVFWKEEFKAVVIQDTYKGTVNSESNEEFKGGRSLITIPINFPENTVKWYYEFSATQNKKELNKISNSFNLFSELTGLIEQFDVLSFGIEQLTKPLGSSYCDIYLVDNQNMELSKIGLKYLKLVEGSRDNVSSAIVEVSNNLDTPLYLQIKNTNYLHGVQFAIQIVAVVKQELGL